MILETEKARVGMIFTIVPSVTQLSVKSRNLADKSLAQ